MKDVAKALAELIGATKCAAGKPADDPSMYQLKSAAKVGGCPDGYDAVAVLRLSIQDRNCLTAGGMALWLSHCTTEPGQICKFLKMEMLFFVLLCLSGVLEPIKFSQKLQILLSGPIDGLSCSRPE